MRHVWYLVLINIFAIRTIGNGRLALAEGEETCCCSQLQSGRKEDHASLSLYISNCVWLQLDHTIYFPFILVSYAVAQRA